VRLLLNGTLRSAVRRSSDVPHPVAALTRLSGMHHGDSFDLDQYSAIVFTSMRTSGVSCPVHDHTPRMQCQPVVKWNLLYSQDNYDEITSIFFVELLQSKHVTQAQTDHADSRTFYSAGDV